MQAAKTGGSGFDPAEPFGRESFDPESFDPESFDPELTTEGLEAERLVAGQPRSRCCTSDTYIRMEKYPMPESFQIFPVGAVRKKEESTWIEIFEPFSDALLGLEGFSHIQVLFWFHENDTADRRKTLRVHPRKDEKIPLTGVFATHSPLRPNLIGLTRCRIKSIKGRHIEIEDIDAFDGSPVIDIKCYIPGSTSGSEVKVPDWV